MTLGKTVRLDFFSTFEMLDFVQLVSDELGHMFGMEEDAVHWVGVAIRESVINAIKHGNQADEAKRVTLVMTVHPESLEVRVQDQGAGFDPSSVPDPLAEENLLKADGRGIFFMRSFMDDVILQRAPEGGMEIRMTKRVQPAA